MNNLTSAKCEACNKMTPKLSDAEIAELLGQLKPGWEAVNNHHLLKEWTFKDFWSPWKLIDAFAEIAEEEGHHPDIKFGWGYVEVTIFTHAIDGLSKNDFILAAKLDASG